MRLHNFQKEFISKALKPKVRTAALSLPRGNGKSTLIAELARRTLTPGDSLFRSGTESFIFAASMGQARRTVFGVLAKMLDPTQYRIAKGANNVCSATHIETETRITTLAANSKTAQGLVGCPWVFADEPGSWEIIGGESLYDAIDTAQGKPGPPMKVFYCGTLAPATSGWWHDLVKEGTKGSQYVMSLKGNAKRWDKLTEVKRVNPLMYSFAPSRDRLREELAKAKKDTRLKARFLSYRMNLPSQDEAAVLLAVADWELMVARAVAAREGQPCVGIDLGAGRGWSAAVGVWPNGRVEAVASAPGIPNIRDQEIRDHVPSGTYANLINGGVLQISAGKRVQPPKDLMEMIRPWNPGLLIADRFRLGELLDAKPPCQVQPRVVRWSDSSADIRGLRKLAMDGPLNIAPNSRELLKYSLSVSRVENDDSGNCRLIKKGSNNLARDDVSAAFVLAAGALARVPATRTGKITVVR